MRDLPYSSNRPRDLLYFDGFFSRADSSGRGQVSGSFISGVSVDLPPLFRAIHAQVPADHSSEMPFTLDGA
jgi:hypothetical protein